MIEFATLDGLTIHDLSTDSNIQVSSVAGITGLPNIRGEIYDRPENDGGVEPANQYLGVRYSTWEFGCFGNTIADARATWTLLLTTLRACVSQQKQLRWRANGDTLNLQSNVRVSSMTPPTLNNDSMGARYMAQVIFRHADPQNYDQTSTLVATGAPTFAISGMPFPVPFPVPWAIVVVGTGAVNVTNNGDAPAWPIIEIAGPITNPVVQNSTTGKALYFDGLALSAGDTLSIYMNPAGRSASVAGVSQFKSIRMSASEFFSVSPASTESIAISGAATDENTTMTVSLRSAYIT